MEPENTETVETPVAKSAPKERDSVFDVAKGAGILFVLGIHCTGNSARLYTASHSIGWWILQVSNRVFAFAVPLFLLVSSVLAARSLCSKPQVLSFYKRRFGGVLWPYLVWSLIYDLLRLLKDPAARKIETSTFLGLHLTGPALFVHVKPRLLELVWGKSHFHLYFLVVLLEFIILLPPAVAYLRWRKPGFYEMLATSFLLQAIIFVIQHKTALLPFPATTALWYMGSLFPGAWIGINWDEFKSNSNRYSIPLSIITLISGYLFIHGEIGLMNGIPVDNYTANGSLTVYASCLSILVLSWSFAITKQIRARKVLEPLGLLSLQIYLIHPAIILALERPAIVDALKATSVGAILSPMLMFVIVLALIWLLKLVRLEKPLFGR